MPQYQSMWLAAKTYLLPMPLGVLTAADGARFVETAGKSSHAISMLWRIHGSIYFIFHFLILTSHMACFLNTHTSGRRKNEHIMHSRRLWWNRQIVESRKSFDWCKNGCTFRLLDYPHIYILLTSVSKEEKKREEDARKQALIKANVASKSIAVSICTC